MCDLSIITLHCPLETDLRADTNTLIEYLDQNNLSGEWLIVVTHQHAGRAVEHTRPTRTLSLRILTVDDVTEAGIAHALTYAKGHPTTLSELVAARHLTAVA